MPGTSVRNSSLSPCSAMAMLVATSSIVRLKASPVGEKPNGDSSTIAPVSIARRIAVASTLRTSPLDWKSTPSTMPTGRAVRKLPEITRTVAFAIGVFGRPCENAASISKRSWPAASCAESSATSSVMRMPWLNFDCVALGPQLLVDLRPKAVHQHQLDAHRVQDRQVLREQLQLAGGDRLAGDGRPRRSCRGRRGCTARPRGTRGRRCAGRRRTSRSAGGGKAGDCAVPREPVRPVRRLADNPRPVNPPPRALPEKSAVDPVAAAAGRLPAIEFPESLPVSARRDEIARGDRRAPGGHRLRRDRLGQDHAAAEDRAGAGPRQAECAGRAAAG